MPNTMKAAVVRAFGKPLTIEEVPMPTPGPGEVLVKIAASGVCHTDLHAADGDWPVKPSPPFIPGHEGASVVAAVGPGVTSLKEGDPVGIAWLHDACGSCEFCITGWETLCPFQHNTGYGVNGTFAEYAIAAAPFVGRLAAPTDFVGLHRSCAPASRLTKASRKRRHAPVSGWSSRASAGWATSRFSTQRPWGCGSSRSMCRTTSSFLRDRSALKSWSTAAPIVPSPTS